MQVNEVQKAIKKECNELAKFLIGKNKKYGNSAIDPIRIFSKSSPIEQINVRLDDKLSRIVRGNKKIKEDEDVDLDFVGYLILKRIAIKYNRKVKNDINR